MRPWTLYNQDENENNPLLANMGLIDNSSDGENRSIRSYATAWGQYINGNVVSELSRQYKCIKWYQTKVIFDISEDSI